MRSRTYPKPHRRKGFTLVELIVVLALFGMVVLGVTQFLTFAMNNWTRNEVQNGLYLDTMVVMTNLSRDIRSADKPNARTSAVVDPTTTGLHQSIDIYKLDSATGRMERIRYEWVSGAIRRGWVSSDETAYPYFWNSSSGTALTKPIPPANYSTLLTGAADLGIFSFAVDPTSAIQTVRVQLTVNDAAKPLVQPIYVDAQYTARNSGN